MAVTDVDRELGNVKKAMHAPEGGASHDWSVMLSVNEDCNPTLDQLTTAST